MSSLTPPLTLSRFLLFVIGCLGLRAAFVYAAIYYPQYLKYMAVVATAIGLGFIYLFLSGARPTGPEAGGRIWWNALRPIHGILYLTFAYLAFQSQSFSYLPLALDWIIGFAAFVMYHFL